MISEHLPELRRLLGEYREAEKMRQTRCRARRLDRLRRSGCAVRWSPRRAPTASRSRGPVGTLPDPRSHVERELTMD
jgi:hypothetical protein